MIMSPFTKTRMRFATVFLMLSVLAPIGLQAQNESDMVEFLQAGEEDASKLMNAYLNPMIEGFSYGFNGGWAQTAKAHKTLGFDLMINVNAVFIPSSKNYFDPAKLGLSTVTSFTSEAPNGLAPTIVGPNYATQYTSSVDLDGDGTTDQDFDFAGPEGFDFKDKIKVSGVAAPTVTLGIGVYKNTDLKIRFMPEVGSDNSKAKLFGVGVMHDIKQHIPGIKLLPFDLSVLAAFTKIQGHSGLEGAFDRGDGDTNPQRVNYDMNAWLIQGMISKKFSVITLYGGIGYNAVKTKAKVKGSYKIYDDTSGLNSDVVFTDPVSLSFKNNGLRATAGFRLKLAVVCLSADYTLQEYSTLSIGFGFAVR
jgi:hypothetical protein